MPLRIGQEIQAVLWQDHPALNRSGNYTTSIRVDPNGNLNFLLVPFGTNWRLSARTRRAQDALAANRRGALDSVRSGFRTAHKIGDHRARSLL
jgi:hypothetical protein